MNNQKRSNIDSFSRGSQHRNFGEAAPHVQALKDRQARQRVSPQNSNSKDVHISLKLTVPSFALKASKNLGRNLSKFKKLKFPNPSDLTKSRRLKPLAAGLAVLLLAFGAWQIFLNKLPARPEDQGQVQGAQNLPPDYEPVVPADKKDIERKFDSQRRVFSYNDTLAGVPITVSQQKMPDSFKLDPQGSVETLAKKFNATTPIEAGDTKAFAGKSSQGPQSVIFHKNGNLIFIYAGKEISKENIITYIKILGG